MSDVVIRIEGLGKRYRLGQLESYKTLRDTLTAGLSAPLRLFNRGNGVRPEQEDTRHIWALRDVSLEVRAGEVVGIIGPNGAGKSTLLKVLTRVTEPTTGRAEIRGRVGSLLEVGTGFHPELTGRENIYLSGAILGMRKAEIDRQFDEIVAFAGVEQFVDTPVKRYSSGMAVRLGFSVAAHLNTDILLVDEVLAVGDSAFRIKSRAKMKDSVGKGKTVVFVSHDMDSVLMLCQKAIVLCEGRLIYEGETGDAVAMYLMLAREATGNGLDIDLREHPRRNQNYLGPVRFTRLRIRGEDNTQEGAIRCGGKLRIRLAYELLRGHIPQRVHFAFTILNDMDRPVATCRLVDVRTEWVWVDGPGEVECEVPRLSLRPGTYKVSVGCGGGGGTFDEVVTATSFEITGYDFYPGKTLPVRQAGELLMEHSWKIIESSS
jgi:lipopolysaccharide transport system ATP-binding protein